MDEDAFCDEALELQKSWELTQTTLTVFMTDTTRELAFGCRKSQTGRNETIDRIA